MFCLVIRRLSQNSSSRDLWLGPQAGLADWLSLPVDPPVFKEGASGQAVMSTILGEIQHRVLISLKGLLCSESSCVLLAKWASKRGRETSGSF